ncbi:class I SAM-dependent methyltransferase [Dictyobacter kobayashii]|uniref:Methyltransferase domain-containing protein n=1 Tax=Dictyobacter kobayashii TaxID=2014872 RepID=A0A402AUT1_9CHLR|nr:class I SAM-dependent methyltransferase [Dictyobacter kobayashii]GCE22886.1 hypothetical protein KDK_66860 [Dictyobacter kobayashii]
MVAHESCEEHNHASHQADPGNAAQIAHLFDLSRLLTEAMGGLFTEREPADLIETYTILDISCGPGSWALDVAQGYPQIEVSGVDINEAAIDYARAHARVRRLANVHFYAMDILNELNFPAESFDLINLNLILGSLIPSYYTAIILNSHSLLHSGGTLRLIVSETIECNMPALHNLNMVISTAFANAGQQVCSNGKGAFHNSQLIQQLLQQHRFKSIQLKPYRLDFSARASANKRMYENYRTLCALYEPFILKWQNITSTKEDFWEICQRAFREMLDTNFRAHWHLTTIWGEK